MIGLTIALVYFFIGAPNKRLKENMVFLSKKKVKYGFIVSYSMYQAALYRVVTVLLISIKSK
jgi:hypothetical protein